MKHVYRFFVPYSLADGQTTGLSEEDAFHAARVLRLREGDGVELVDSEGRVYPALIKTVRKDGRPVVEATPESEPLAASPLAAITPLTVAQALPSGKKMDLIVEKLTELGVSRIVPLFSQKSLLREASDREGRLERWRRIARSAAAQAKRTDVPAVDAPYLLEEWLEMWHGPLLALVTEVSAPPLGEAIAGLTADGTSIATSGLALLAGPEAGFSEPELEALDERGAVLASLGPLVVRTETAALVATAITMHRLGTLG